MDEAGARERTRKPEPLVKNSAFEVKVIQDLKSTLNYFTGWVGGRLGIVKLEPTQCQLKLELRLELSLAKWLS